MNDLSFLEPNKYQKKFIQRPVPELDLKQSSINGKRYYVNDDGIKYPSVTTVLGGSKPAKDQKVLDDWKKRVGTVEAERIVRKATGRGDLLHDMLEHYVNGEEVGTNNHITEGMFISVKKHLDEHLKAVYGNEVYLYSDKLKTAGAVDLAGIWDNKNAIVDFKNSLKPKKKAWIKDYFMQASAYGAMMYERHGIKVSKLVILIATPEHGCTMYEENIGDWLPEFLKRRQEYTIRHGD